MKFFFVRQIVNTARLPAPTLKSRTSQSYTTLFGIKNYQFFPLQKQMPGKILALPGIEYSI